MEANETEKKPKKDPSAIAVLKKRRFTEAELAAPRSPEQFRLALRRKTRIYYDMQELRMQTGGRLTKKAVNASIELHPRDISKLLTRFDDLEKAETRALKDLEEQLHEVPYYRDIMLPERKTRYKGLGPRMASIILSSFDIEREETVSQMWSFAGLAPLPAKRCKDCFAVLKETTPDNTRLGIYFHPQFAPHRKKFNPDGTEVEQKPRAVCQYTNREIGGDHVRDSGKQARPVSGEKLKYNAWLRTKLCGVLAPVLLKLGSPYRQYYDNYKQRWEQAGKGTSPAHRHAASMRYMIKMLLLDIHREWRTHEGLSVRPPYSEEYLGHKTSMKPIGTSKPVLIEPPQQDFTDRLAEELLEEELSLEDDSET